MLPGQGSPCWVMIAVAILTFPLRIAKWKRFAGTVRARPQSLTVCVPAILLITLATYAQEADKPQRQPKSDESPSARIASRSSISSQPINGHSQTTEHEPTEHEPTDEATYAILPGTIQTQIRVLWGSPTARPFSGTIRITGGEIDLQRNLSLQEDSIDRMRTVSPRELQILPHSAATFGGVDIEVTGSPEATVEFEFFSMSGGGSAIKESFSLRELLNRPELFSLDTPGARVAIDRPAQDRVRFEFDRELKVVEVGESFSASVEGFFTRLPPGEYNLAVSMSPTMGGGRREIVERSIRVDSNGSFEAVPFDLQVPQDEGAYLLEVRCREKRFLPKVLTQSDVLRRYEFVAFDSNGSDQRITGWRDLTQVNALRCIAREGLDWMVPSLVAESSAPHDLPLSPVRPAAGIERTNETENPNKQNSSGGWSLPGLQSTQRVVASLTESPWNPLSGAGGAIRKDGELGKRLIQNPSQAGLPPAGQDEQHLSTTTENVPEQLECLWMAPGAWIDIPLGELDPSKPHRLIVRAPIDQPNRLNLSIRTTAPPSTQTSANASDSLGNDYQIVESRLSALQCIAEQTPSSQTAPAETHSEKLGTLNSLKEYTFLFWPRGGGVYVRLMNVQSETTASIFDLRVQQAEVNYDRPYVETNSNSANPTNSATSPVARESLTKLSPQQHPWVGITLDKPLIASWFGTSLTKDPQSERFYESWHTVDVACRRLMTYLDWCQANLLVVKIQADGGALFPSRSLAPTPRLDGGLFFSDGRCPEIKDSVTLLLNHCQRAGIRVVLAMDLDSPLADLGQRGSDVYQRHLDGTRVTRDYEPLHPAVQSKLLSIVDEVGKKYGNHPAFAGIQLQIDGDSPLTYRGDLWGYGQPQLEAFAQAFNIELPSDAGERARQFRSDGGETIGPAYLRWRARKVADFLESLHARLATYSADSKLYLDTLRLWEKSPDKKDFAEPKTILRKPPEHMLAMGIDPNYLRRIEPLVLLEGSLVSSRDTLSSDDWIRQLARSQGLNRRVEEGNPPQTSRGVSLLLQPEEISPALGTAHTSDSDAAKALFPIDVGSSSPILRSLSTQFANHDTTWITIGSWLPLGQNTEAIRHVYGSLRGAVRSADTISGETNRFVAVHGKRATLRKPAKVENSAITVRIQGGESQSNLTLVNRSPWKQKCALVVHAQPDSKAQLLFDDPVETASQVDTNRLDLRREPTGEGRENWQIELEPFELVAINIDDPAFQVLDIVSAPPNAVVTVIASQISKLEQVLNETADPTQQHLLRNIFGGFEHWSNEFQSKNDSAVPTPVGWNISAMPGVRIARSSDFPHSGNSCLSIQNQNPELSAWVHSKEFPVPANGRLTLRAWLRSPTINSSAVVRLSIVGRTLSGKRIERSKQFGSREQGVQKIANDWGVRPAILEVGDLPVDELDTILVAIELVGRGQVWVDDVEVLESWLHADERVYLQSQMLVAKSELQKNNPMPAERLLSSSWGQYLSRFHPTMQPAQSLPAYQNSTAQPTGVRTNWSSTPSLFQQFRKAMVERWRR